MWASPSIPRMRIEVFEPLQNFRSIHHVSNLTARQARLPIGPTIGLVKTTVLRFDAVCSFRGQPDGSPQGSRNDPN